MLSYIIFNDNVIKQMGFAVQGKLFSDFDFDCCSGDKHRAEGCFPLHSLLLQLTIFSMFLLKLRRRFTSTSSTSSLTQNV